MEQQGLASEAINRDPKRRWVGLLSNIALLATLLVAPLVSVVIAEPESAKAADLSLFDPGYIISDELFYDGNAMTAAQVQTFLNSRLPNCVAGNGYPCLKNYTDTTVNKPASPNVNGPGTRCSAISGGRTLTAAQIIAEVGQACGISQKALLVILQKERGLITKTSPTVSDYRISMGYGCPDTAPCNTEYYGFFNQIFLAAQQYKIYKDRSTSYNYQAGRTNFIYWHPNASCGGSNVYIRNQATAGLYIYTPYQPNAAALAAGYGTGNSCSSYGNRNFFHYYNDWFGPSNMLASGPIANSWKILGGGSGVMGNPVAAQYSVGGGLVQEFDNGWLVYHSQHGIHRIDRLFGEYYFANGGVGGDLGWPKGSTNITANGFSQLFQYGTLGWTSSGGFVPQVEYPVTGPINNEWLRLGGPAGILGLPIDHQRGLAEGAVGQEFELGWIISHPAKGTFRIAGPVADYYFANGGSSGDFGFPLSSPSGNESAGYSQKFEFGEVSWTLGGGISTIGGFRVSDRILTSWTLLGKGQGDLGYPISSQVSYLGGGVAQQFEHAWLVSHPLYGIHKVSGALGEYYFANGGPNGDFGYPKSSMSGSESTDYRQVFEHGVITGSAANGFGIEFTVSGVIGNSWTILGGNSGVLGKPIGPQVNVPGGGIQQQFQKGWLIYHLNHGIHRLSGTLAQSYFDLGGVESELGYPKGGASGSETTGYSQAFEHGSLLGNTRDGYEISFAVTGMINTSWQILGANQGILGKPISAQRSFADGGIGQKFEQGWLIYKAGVGIHRIYSPIADAYFADGGPMGAMGYPMGSTTSGPNYSQTFHNGKILWNDAEGITKLGGYEVSGRIKTSWDALGGVNGTLGYPVAQVKTHGGGAQYQKFEKGWLIHLPNNGIHRLAGPIADFYFDNPQIMSDLGYPINSISGSETAGFEVKFDNGKLLWTRADGISQIGGFAVTGRISTSWAALGGPNGVLGYPLGVSDTLSEGARIQRFEYGWLIDHPLKGIHRLTNPLAGYYFDLGGTTSSFGFPVGSISETSEGYSQLFEFGKITQNSSGQISTVGGYPVTGRIYTSWVLLQSFNGPLGYPVATTENIAGGNIQEFQKGWLIDHATYGIHRLSGPIADYYFSLGGVTSTLGFPTSSIQSDDEGVQYQNFQNGKLRILNGQVVQVGGFAVTGWIATSWNALGNGAGMLGYPVADANNVQNGRTQQFERGWLIEHTSIGIHRSSGKIAEYYFANGGPAGSLGFPTNTISGTEETGYSQQFQHAIITWSQENGLVVVPR